jgi:hypothetical protein
LAKRYLEEFGVRIARNGYAVIPIIPGEKRPYGKKWQTYDGTEEGVEDWLASGKGSFGVGIKTKDCPAVDIDVHEPEVVERLKAMVFSKVGKTLQRVGLPPKTLLPYQTDVPFPKVDTGFWLDDKGRTVKVEILGDGQQFVAAHVHPDTGKPYQWLDGKSVLNTPLSDLPILRQQHAEEIKTEALAIFAELGWQRKSTSIQRLSATGADPDDPFAGIRPKTDISDEKLADQLMLVPGNDDYERWFLVGMALHHQYDGTQQGLDLWHQWSASAPNYDADVLDKKWPTFEHKADEDRPPITARIILKLAKEETKKVDEETLETVSLQLAEASDLKELTAVCDIIKSTQFSMVVREMLVGRVKERFKKITGVAPRIGVVRDMTRYESPETHEMPGWLKNWVYCQHDETFFHVVDRRSISKAAFDSSHARLMLTPSERDEGKSVPETLASAAALNLYQIPVVYNRMYLPGQPPLYKLNGIAYVNSYTDAGIPELPGEYSAPEWQAVQTILYHFEHLFRNERDRRIFIDWITYVVQNPGGRINWAILLQGTEGDGKSFFSLLLKAILGMTNVNVIPGKSLEEKYNPWAEGAMVCFVEDVRLHGNNRFDAINTLKPMITNATTSIRRMNTNIYEVVNTMNYITTANIKDALPVGHEDSRFFPLFTRFQSQPSIMAFKAAHPDYYTRLHGALNFAGALRKFFLERPLSDDFSPRERAPASSYKAEMIEMNRADDEQALLDALEESTRLDFSSLLLDSGLIHEEFMERDALPPNTKALKRLLSTNGFTFLGRITVEGKKHRFWSQRPDIWSTDQDRLADEIRDYLSPDGL